MVRILVSSRRPCDSEALATSSYGDELRPALVGGDLGQRRGQRGLAVVDVADGADVDVRFGPIEFFFRHDSSLRAHCYPAPCRRRLRCPRACSRSRSRLQPKLRAATVATIARLLASEATARQPCSRLHSRAKVGADDQDRTGDLVLTKDALCQLSYIGLRLAPARADSGYGRQVGRVHSGWHSTRPLVACHPTARTRSTRAKAGAGDGDRTRDQQLGRL